MAWAHSILCLGRRQLPSCPFPPTKAESSLSLGLMLQWEKGRELYFILPSVSYMYIYVYVCMSELEHVQAFSILWQRQQLSKPDQVINCE